MKTQDKATPRPWNRNIKADGKYPTIFSGRNTHVCVVSQQKSPEVTEANIDLIIESVNNYETLKAQRDALLKALKDFRRRVHSVSDFCVADADEVIKEVENA